MFKPIFNTTLFYLWTFKIIVLDEWRDDPFVANIDIANMWSALPIYFTFKKKSPQRSRQLSSSMECGCVWVVFYSVARSYTLCLENVQGGVRVTGRLVHSHTNPNQYTPLTHTQYTNRIETIHQNTQREVVWRVLRSKAKHNKSLHPNKSRKDPLISTFANQANPISVVCCGCCWFRFVFCALSRSPRQQSKRPPPTSIISPLTNRKLRIFLRRNIIILFLVSLLL